MFENLLSQNDQAALDKLQSKANERLKDIYTNFARPYTGSLLRTLNLDINYTDGSGNWLTIKTDDGRKPKMFT